MKPSGLQPSGVLSTIVPYSHSEMDRCTTKTEFIYSDANSRDDVSSGL